MLARNDDIDCESAVSKIIRERMITCEITANSAANWYLVQTMPNEEGMALRWLARKGFGAFRPMQQRTDKRNGTKVQGWEPVFPGWLFVFIWNIETMKDRIQACPGVFKVFSDPATKRPIVITDQFIDTLRARAWAYEDNARAMRVESRKPKVRASRTQKRHRKALHKLKKTLKRSGNWDSSTWEAMNKLAAHDRITLLKRAITNGAALAGYPA